MKLFNSGGPNPRMVRMFMAEKGFDVPKVDVDLRGGEKRREPYLKVNPSGQTPALELDDHLDHCVRHAVANGEDADAKLAEASAAIARLVRS